MFNRRKVIVNGGVDIELSRLVRSERYDRRLFMPENPMQTVIVNDSETENVWQLVLKNTRTGKTVSRCFTKRIVLGRGASLKGEKDFMRVTSNPTVGREHCVISVCNRTVYINDCGSVNGTYVDGKRITGREKLPLKCQLRLSKETYKLYLREK